MPSGLHSAPTALPTALLVSRTAFCWFCVTVAARLDLALGSMFLSSTICLILLAKVCLQPLSRLLCPVRHLRLRSPEQTGWMPSSLKGASVGQSAKRHSTAVSQVYFGWFTTYRFSLAPNTLFLNHSEAGVRRACPKRTICRRTLRMVELAKRLRRKRPKGGQRSLREIAVELEKAGYVSRSGKPYGATAVARMLGELQ